VEHVWKVERKVYDKSGAFDPKTMPIADYWEGRTCQVCGALGGTTVGYIKDGKDLPYGMSFGGYGDCLGGV
jgi:hypothetical protein